MIAKYPEHLTQELRLKVVKSYILHELASLTRDKTPDVINIDGLVKKCHEHKKGIEEDCKEIYDLFYGLSLTLRGLRGRKSPSVRWGMNSPLTETFL